MYLFIYLFMAPTVIEENRLRHFGHVNRMPRRVIEWKAEGTRINGRHKKRRTEE